MSLSVLKHRASSASRQRTTTAKRGWRARSFVQLVLLLFAAAMVVDALVGDQGLLARRREQRRYEDMAATLARTKLENARRREEVQRLENDPRAIEDAARRDLGFIRRGEKVFILKDLPSPAK